METRDDAVRDGLRTTRRHEKLCALIDKAVVLDLSDKGNANSYRSVLLAANVNDT